MYDSHVEAHLTYFYVSYDFTCHSIKGKGDFSFFFFYSLTVLHFKNMPIAQLYHMLYLREMKKEQGHTRPVQLLFVL